MLRNVVISTLKSKVPLLERRIYEAFLAPARAIRPYATVKISTARGSPELTFGGTQPVEVRIYDDQVTYAAIDAIEVDVIAALHGQPIRDPITWEQHELTWEPGYGDFTDEDKKLIGRLVTFGAALLYEPGGGK